MSLFSSSSPPQQGLYSIFIMSNRRTSASRYRADRAPVTDGLAARLSQLTTSSSDDSAVLVQAPSGGGTFNPTPSSGVGRAGGRGAAFTASSAPPASGAIYSPLPFGMAMAPRSALAALRPSRGIDSGGDLGGESGEGADRYRLPPGKTTQLRTVRDETEFAGLCASIIGGGQRFCGRPREVSTDRSGRPQLRSKGCGVHKSHRSGAKMSVESFPVHFIPDKSGLAWYVHPHLLGSRLSHDEDIAEAESGKREDTWWRSYIANCNVRYEEAALEMEGEDNQDDASNAADLRSAGEESYVAIPRLGSFPPGDVYEIDCGDYEVEISSEDQGSIHAATRAVVDNVRAEVQEIAGLIPAEGTRVATHVRSNWDPVVDQLNRLTAKVATLAAQTAEVNSTMGLLREPLEMGGYVALADCLSDLLLNSGEYQASVATRLRTCMTQ